MGELMVRGASGALVKFDPQTAKIIHAGLKAAIKQAEAMQDWAAGNRAIEALIDLQAKFVVWWKRAVTPNQYNVKEVVSLRKPLSLSAEEASVYTGINKLQVHRWRGRLKDLAACRRGLCSNSSAS